MKTSLIGLLFIAATAVSFAAPANIIFDTEMSSDCDSAGALAVLNHLADLGEANILACVADAVEPDHAIAASISAINTYYGRSDVPIGTYHGATIRPGKSLYTAAIRDEFPHRAKPDDQEPPALDVYRAALAGAPDGSVTIISLGFLVNLHDLLDSKPDATSPLAGLELVRKKVKQLVVVGGFFPKDNTPTRTTPEYNFGGANAAGALDTQYVVEHWPSPILFSDFSLSQGTATGPCLQPVSKADPVRRIYELFGALQNGRSSWCQTTVLAAVRDPEAFWEVKRDGYCKVEATGQSHWTPEPHRGHSYLVTKVPQREMEKIIGDLMAAPPQAKSH